MNMLHFKTEINPNSLKWIVFIHGAGGSLDTWNYQWEEMSSHFNLLAIDLRDHGKSKNILPDKEVYEFQLITTDILKVIDFLDIEKAYFVTLSFGSVLMQDLSMRRPELVCGAVLAGAIFKGNLLIKTFVHLARFFNFFLSYSQMYSLFSYLLMPKKEHQRSRRIYKIQATKIGSEEYMKWLGLYSSFFYTLRKFSSQQIHFPTLIIMGADDFVFLSAAREFNEKQRYTRLKIIEGAGHICNIDKPMKFNEIMRRFLLNDKLVSQKTNSSF
ncbi:alpha/beta hydrolase [Mangrovivirga sp. M17]|uniref:Alpha/beta hydrolase n=1 Tax=Mangrovivirga halotolerans TaxID=2993936 RepID=A0ABT3RWX2_9BACT|nr:alpha/beta hydrolase [Mangrovivirga halotolerans]MCX2746046.1 alpha/beta hydrolase [Mangrovivirga halotolerans]